MLTKQLQQTLLNQAVAKIREQGRPSGYFTCLRCRCKRAPEGCICPDTTNHRFHCQYRSEGACCAVGALIPDEYYKGSMEGESAEDAGVVAALQISGIPIESDDDVDFMMELQHAHDDAAESAFDDGGDGSKFLPLFNERIRGVCRERGLYYPEVQS